MPRLLKVLGWKWVIEVSGIKSSNSKLMLFRLSIFHNFVKKSHWPCRFLLSFYEVAVVFLKLVLGDAGCSAVLLRCTQKNAGEVMLVFLAKL